MLINKWDNGRDKHFSNKKFKKMTSNYFKLCSASLFIKEMLTKTALRHHLIVRMLVIKRSHNKCGESGSLLNAGIAEMNLNTAIIKISSVFPQQTDNKTTIRPKYFTPQTYLKPSSSLLWFLTF